MFIPLSIQNWIRFLFKSGLILPSSNFTLQKEHAVFLRCPFTIDSLQYWQRVKWEQGRSLGEGLLTRYGFCTNTTLLFRISSFALRISLEFRQHFASFRRFILQITHKALILTVFSFLTQVSEQPSINVEVITLQQSAQRKTFSIL